VLDCRSKTENRIRQFLWLATGLPLLDRFRRLPYEGAEQTFQALSLFQDVSDVPQADPAYPAARFPKRSQFVIHAKGMTVTPRGSYHQTGNACLAISLLGLPSRRRSLWGEILNFARDRRGSISPFHPGLVSLTAAALGALPAGRSERRDWSSRVPAD
jgi:hypothetical protein